MSSNENEKAIHSNNELHHDRNISDAVIKRLPRYYRYLRELLSHGRTRISSAELAGIMNVTASQIRQDLNCFGGFGQQGYGYNVEYLHDEIGTILGLKEGYTTIIVGAGCLGHALANYKGFEKRGFHLKGIFDCAPEKIGRSVGGVTVSDIADMEDFVRANNIDIAILTVPRSEVKSTADRLAECGIKGLWNYSFVELKTKNDVAVENVHLSDSLMTLSYKIKQRNDE